MKHQLKNSDETDVFIRTLARKMDFSCVRTIHDQLDLENLVEKSKLYRPACAFVLPYFTEYLIGRLADCHDVTVGGVIGFPSGGETVENKMYQARELRRKGCGELDMVMNLTLLKTERFQDCLEDIRSVVGAAGNIPVKVIIEAPVLTEDEICRASEISVKAGAAFVKTGTGWLGPATVRQVELIGQTIGDAASIKAAGGIRTLEQVKQLYEAGCDRFGIGSAAAEAILKEVGYGTR